VSGNKELIVRKWSFLGGYGNLTGYNSPAFSHVHVDQFIHLHFISSNSKVRRKLYLESQEAGFLFTGSTAPWALASRVISSSQGLYLNIGQHRHRIDTHTHTKHPCLVRDSNPWSRLPSEDNTCLRTLGYRDRRSRRIILVKSTQVSYLNMFKLKI
jgi:hypothetical protein